MEKINQFFKIKERKTNLRTEIIAGITTFMTMAYILVVQPALIVGNAGTITDVNGVVISKEAIMVTCALVSAVITMFMAVYANLPFALATGMGSNALFGGMLIAGEISFGGIMSMTLDVYKRQRYGSTGWMRTLTMGVCQSCRYSECARL